MRGSVPNAKLCRLSSGSCFPTTYVQRTHVTLTSDLSHNSPWQQCSPGNSSQPMPFSSEMHLDSSAISQLTTCRVFLLCRNDLHYEIKATECLRKETPNTPSAGVASVPSAQVNAHVWSPTRLWWAARGFWRNVSTRTRVS